MHFRAAASVAILACAAGSQAAAAPQPYRLAMMPVLGNSLMSRDTNGYKPDQTHCNKGADCAAACGAGYTQCGSSNDDLAHCFNPAAGQTCCPDNSGNSCEAGYYCTADHKKQTWCCPDGMDLAACAAAYSVKGGLVMATASTTTTHSSTTTHSTTHSTTTESSTTTVMTNTTTPVTTTTESTSSCTGTSAGHTTAWTGSNSTIVTYTPTQQPPTQPSVTVVQPQPPVGTAPITKPNSAAAATTFSGLLLAAAGFVALL